MKQIFSSISIVMTWNYNSDFNGMILSMCQDDSDSFTMYRWQTNETLKQEKQYKTVFASMWAYKII